MKGSQTHTQTDRRKEGKKGGVESKPEQRGCYNRWWVLLTWAGIFSWSTELQRWSSTRCEVRAARWAHEVLQMLFVWMKRHNAERGGGEREREREGSFSSFDPGTFQFASSWTNMPTPESVQELMDCGVMWGGGGGDMTLKLMLLI